MGLLNFFKELTQSKTDVDKEVVVFEESDNENDEDDKAFKRRVILEGEAITKSVNTNRQKADAKYAKPDKYTGNRDKYDSGSTKRKVKEDAFNSSKTVKDPYTEKKLCLTKKEAKAKYGEKWSEHLAETDHIRPIEKVFDEYKDSAWLDNNDIKEMVNSSENTEVVSRKFNNAKRSKTNEELVDDDEYMKKTGLKLSKAGKEKAKESSNNANKAINRQAQKKVITNVVKTGHAAGMESGSDAAATAATVESIRNIVCVINGEKDADEAIKDVSVASTKAAAYGYVSGGGLTVINHTLTSSKSKFLKALGESNAAGKVVTAVILTGDALKKYAKGEINTTECLLELGQNNLNMVSRGYAMLAGEILCPIPVLGGVLGAFVGEVLTANLYDDLFESLQNKKIAEEKRRIIGEQCQRIKEENERYQLQLRMYLDNYFKDHRDCFDDAFSQIYAGVNSCNADEIIAGSNKITRKLGGRPQYNNVEEYKAFVKSGEKLIL